MSTNIYDVWRIPTQDLSELTDIGKKVRKIQSESYFKEISENILEWPWTISAVMQLYEADPKFNKLPCLADAALLPVFFMKQGTGTMSLYGWERDVLERLIQSELSSMKLTLTGTQIKGLLQLFSDLLELMLKSDCGVTFLKGDNGASYAKFYGPTAAVRDYLDREFENFAYTDATSMDIKCFGADKQAAYFAAATDKERRSILDAAQEERGQCWSDALNGNHVWKDAGLYFDLQPEHFRPKMFKFLCDIFSEACDRGAQQKELQGGAEADIPISSEKYIGLVFRSNRSIYYVNRSGLFLSIFKPPENEAVVTEANAAYFDMIHSFGYSTRSVGAVENALKKHVGRSWPDVLCTLRAAGKSLVESQNKDALRQTHISEQEQQHPEILKGPGVHILYTGKLDVDLRLPDFEIRLPLSVSSYEKQLDFARNNRKGILKFALGCLQADKRRMSRIGNINLYALSDFTVTRQSEISLLFSLKQELLNLTSD